MTDDPLLVRVSWSLPRVPGVLLGLHAGVTADRFDHRRLLVLAKLARVVLVAALAATVAAGSATIGLVLVVVFLFGIVETEVDTTSGACR